MSEVDTLLAAIKAVAAADSLDALMATVRTTARALTKADGVTFVLQEEQQCFYADEEAVAPLWKGKRFPLKQCISGWVMIHAQIAVIPDIYADDRIPVEAYRPTFVKSLAMVPAPLEKPLAAIGAYWAVPHSASWHEQHILQAIANAAGVALHNMPLYADLRRGELSES